MGSAKCSLQRQVALLRGTTARSRVLRRDSTGQWMQRGMSGMWLGFCGCEGLIEKDDDVINCWSSCLLDILLHNTFSSTYGWCSRGVASLIVVCCCPIRAHTATFHRSGPRGLGIRVGGGAVLQATGCLAAGPRVIEVLHLPMIGSANFNAPKSEWPLCLVAL